MRVGSPSLESLLVAANVALALGLGLYLQHDASGAQGTSVEVTARQSEGPPVLVVAAADSRVDLAVAGPAAELLGGVLLAVPSGGVTATVSAALVESRPDRVLVVGGPDAVGDVTARRVAELTGAPVTRLFGGDRHATAVKVVTSQFVAPLPRLRVMSGSGLDGPEPAPETTDAPLLLVERDRVPAVVVAALRQLRPETIEVMGDATAVSEAVLSQLEEYATGEVVRLPRQP